MKWIGVVACLLLTGCLAGGVRVDTPGALFHLLNHAAETSAAAQEAYGKALGETAVRVVREVPFETERPEPWARTQIADFAVARDKDAYLVRENAPAAPIFRPGSDGIPRIYQHGYMTVVVEGIAWDRMRFDLGGEPVPAAALEEYLARWHYDPVKRAMPASEGHIHSVTPRPDGFVVDFGSASPVAVLELVDLLQRSGIYRIHITADSLIGR